MDELRYEKVGAVVTLTINRPAQMNALNKAVRTGLFDGFRRFEADPDARVAILTGAGQKAFCAGMDLKEAAETALKVPPPDFLPILGDTIRVTKPVIAAVNGVAIGGGHVLHVLCDLTVAASHATFGQSGPRVGSFDAGFGSAYLARVVGEKRARQLWFLLDRIDAETAERWGLVNAVVPADALLPTALEWGRRIGSYSPTALRFLKHSFNADSDSMAGLSNLAFAGLDLFSHTAEAEEGARAFAERRPPDFRPYR